MRSWSPSTIPCHTHPLSYHTMGVATVDTTSCDHTCHTIPCHTHPLPYYTIPYTPSTILYHTILYHTIHTLYHTIPYHTSIHPIPYHAIHTLYHTTAYHTIHTCQSWCSSSQLLLSVLTHISPVCTISPSSPVRSLPVLPTTSLLSLTCDKKRTWQ